MLNIRTYTLGPVQTNCYIVSNKQKECLIFDPGSEGEQLVQQLRALNLRPLAILLTHAHFDHIGAVDAVRAVFEVPVYLHKAETNWLLDPMKNGSGRYAELPNITVRPADHLLDKPQELTIGTFTFDIVHTPGHSPGSVSFIFKDEGFAIVGDTLFQGSVGRTDLLGGNEKVLLKSIHDQLLSLDEDLIVYPGHGDATTVGTEMEQNPFLNGFL
ncbi:MBL fold metallo-hydrolase [Viridibacillus sp. YIM B01967]|uniref:MBL fold metallo-hydrolase n=1 Tax=Viridibacillus soli TaxID=2798301 RepID=A0ABS1H4L9_9BACL|nr:MBL fold metallo-hydrolase [Viridibacillus soli]MBK3493998.1 MBL fold metallo-hydrolase [Viridibacillus soli]